MKCGWKDYQTKVFIFSAEEKKASSNQQIEKCIQDMPFHGMRKQEQGRSKQ
jgi:hypothetical protein